MRIHKTKPDYIKQYADKKDKNLDNVSTYRIIKSFVTPGSNLLEIGCGPGYLLEYLGGGAGVDIDPQLILHCKQSYPNSVFVTSDCYSIPLDSKKFDTVVMCMIIEHLKNPVHALTEAKRLLKPGGNIVVVVPRKDDWFYRFIVKKDPTHVREYNVVEISDLLRTVFTIENICFGSVSTKVPSFLTWFLKPDIIINCKKDN